MKKIRINDVDKLWGGRMEAAYSGGVCWLYRPVISYSNCAGFIPIQHETFLVKEQQNSSSTALHLHPLTAPSFTMHNLCCACLRYMSLKRKTPQRRCNPKDSSLFCACMCLCYHHHRMAQQIYFAALQICIFSCRGAPYRICLNCCF